MHLSKWRNWQAIGFHFTSAVALMDRNGRKRQAVVWGAPAIIGHWCSSFRVKGDSRPRDRTGLRLCVVLFRLLVCKKVGADRTHQPLTRSDARCRRSFYYGTRVAVPTLNPRRASTSGNLRVQICCAPGPTYMLKLGPSVMDIVPVQSGATV